MEYIFAMLDLFYANKHMHDKLQKRNRKKEKESVSLTIGGSCDPSCFYERWNDNDSCFCPAGYLRCCSDRGSLLYHAR